MILSLLNKPLPGAGFNLVSLFRYFLVGLFVALFLIVFQPFQINEWHTSHKTLKLFGFGLVSFLVPSIYVSLVSAIFSKTLLEDRWTVGKEIISVTIVLTLIALGNMFYSNMISIMHISFINFINALICVVLLGIFPVSFLVLTRHNRLFRRNVVQAEIINQHLQPPLNAPKEEVKSVSDLLLVSENGKDKLELAAEQLLYVESADNYSNIVFTEMQLLKRHLLRSSLKRIEGQVLNDWILRCHRTYIVNLKNVTRVEGNAAGYKLSMAFGEDVVPVSRNYGPAVIEKLKSLG